jgi:hypothetical protein
MKAKLPDKTPYANAYRPEPAQWNTDGKFSPLPCMVPHSQRMRSTVTLHKVLKVAGALVSTVLNGDGLPDFLEEIPKRRAGPMSSEQLPPNPSASPANRTNPNDPNNPIDPVNPNDPDNPNNPNNPNGPSNPDTNARDPNSPSNLPNPSANPVQPLAPVPVPVPVPAPVPAPVPVPVPPKKKRKRNPRPEIPAHF